jgi:hypothetical protein
MKIRTSIEFEIVAACPISFPMPVVGNSGQTAIVDLQSFLTDCMVLLTDCMVHRHDVQITYSHSEVDPTLRDDREIQDLPDEIMPVKLSVKSEELMRRRFLERLDARLDETEQDIGEWILVEDQLPLCTVLGVSSSECRVKLDNGERTVGYLDNENKWRRKGGEKYFEPENTVVMWAKVRRVIYGDPQEEYEKAARENNEKRGEGLL